MDSYMGVGGPVFKLNHYDLSGQIPCFLAGNIMVNVLIQF